MPTQQKAKKFNKVQYNIKICRSKVKHPKYLSLSRNNKCKNGRHLALSDYETNALKT